MIQSRSLDSCFWAEAINCANFIQNRMPHKALRHSTPKEAWSHVKPDVSTFRVFGSTTYAFVPDAQRKAMERKSQPLIFVGYCENVKAYRLFDPDSREVLFRRDVQFDESPPAVHSSPPVPSSPSTTPSSLPDGFTDDEDDAHDDPTFPPPQDPPQMPK